MQIPKSGLKTTTHKNGGVAQGCFTTRWRPTRTKENKKVPNGKPFMHNARADLAVGAWTGFRDQALFLVFQIGFTQGGWPFTFKFLDLLPRYYGRQRRDGTASPTFIHTETAHEHETRNVSWYINCVTHFKYRKTKKPKPRISLLHTVGFLVLLDTLVALYVVYHVEHLKPRETECCYYLCCSCCIHHQAKRLCEVDIALE